MKKYSWINLGWMLPGWAFCLFILHVPLLMHGLIGLAVLITIKNLAA